MRLEAVGNLERVFQISDSKALLIIWAKVDWPVLVRRLPMVWVEELYLRHRYFAITGAKAEFVSYFLQFEHGQFGSDFIVSIMLVRYSRRLSSTSPQRRQFIKQVLAPSQRLKCHFH